jgi:hypothetical protein
MFPQSPRPWKSSKDQTIPERVGSFASFRGGTVRIAFAVAQVRFDKNWKPGDIEKVK